MFGNNGKYVIFPGFCDVHVHLREPGFSYKETIATGSAAAARGGYTDIFTMPNLSPVPDNAANLKIQTDIIKSDALINVYPYGAITVGEKGIELADMEAMAKDVIAFSDDGKGVQDEKMMLAAMEKAKSLGKVIAAHCEVESLLNGGYIHDGRYAKANGHRGISSESEWREIERDIELAAKTGCAFHVCHVSTKESVELIRQGEKSGVDVTAETAPHYLVMCEDDLKEEGRFKMNPPLRALEDKEALIEGIKDGTLDMIATDHAPHSDEEKSRGLARSPFGIVGLETAFAVLYTKLVLQNVITLDKLIDLMAIAPRKRFGLAIPSDNETNGSFTVFDLNASYKVDPKEFLSKGHATPFEGFELYGKCIKTVCTGKTVYDIGEGRI